MQFQLDIFIKCKSYPHTKREKTQESEKKKEKAFRLEPQNLWLELFIVKKVNNGT
jgi:hypothetical protein